MRRAVAVRPSPEQRLRLERAARLVERAPQVGRRRRRGRRRPASAHAGVARHARAHALGEREQLVVALAALERQQRAREPARAGRQPAGRLVAQRRGQRRPRRRALTERGGASTSTPTRSRRPNGSSRRASSGPASSPETIAGEHVAGQPALGVVGDAPAQQLERDDGDRLVEHEPVELGQRRRGPWPRRARPAAPGRRRCRRRACARPAARARGRAARPTARSRGARRRGRARAARRPSPRSTSAASGAAPSLRASASPRAS